MYKVIIQSQESEAESKYSWDTIYEQQFADINVPGIVVVLNSDAATGQLPPTPSLTLDPAEDFKTEQPPRNGKLIEVKENEDAKES